MFRVKIAWEIEELDPAEVVDAEIISDRPAAEDPELADRLSELAALEALAAALQ